MILLGNTTTPANCIISTSSTCITVNDATCITIKGFKLISSAGNGLLVGKCSIAYIHEMNFGACSNAHMGLFEVGEIYINANYTISGAAAYHLDCEGTGSSVYSSYGAPVTVTVSGAPAFSGAFAVAYYNALIYGHNTYSGAATGKRYDVTFSGSIETFGSGANHFPGDSAGTTSLGGQYN